MSVRSVIRKQPSVLETATDPFLWKSVWTSCHQIHSHFVVIFTFCDKQYYHSHANLWGGSAPEPWNESLKSYMLIFLLRRQKTITGDYAGYFGDKLVIDEWLHLHLAMVYIFLNNNISGSRLLVRWIVLKSKQSSYSESQNVATTKANNFYNYQFCAQFVLALSWKAGRYGCYESGEALAIGFRFMDGDVNSINT